MSENKKMSGAAIAVIVAAVVVVILLFCGMGMRAYNMNSAASEVIGKEKAKETALSHAGVAAETVTHYRAELEIDNGRQIYDIGFKSGGYEFDYDIDAQNGEIISFERDLKD